MITHYLRFPDKSTAMSELRKHGFTQDNEQGEEAVITASHQWAIDCIGPISIGGTYDPETGEVLEVRLRGIIDLIEDGDVLVDL